MGPKRAIWSLFGARFKIVNDFIRSLSMLKLNAVSFGKAPKPAEALVSPGGHLSGLQSQMVHLLPPSLGEVGCILYCEISTANVRWSQEELDWQILLMI